MKTSALQLGNGIVAMIFLACISMPCAATPTLEQRVQALEEQVRELNRRLDQPEAPPVETTKPSVPQAPALSSPPSWQSAANWKKMRAGMNQDQVLSLLGEPEKRSGGRYRQRWDYADGRGWIEFDSGGEVNEWQAP